MFSWSARENAGKNEKGVPGNVLAVWKHGADVPPEPAIRESWTLEMIPN